MLAWVASLENHEIPRVDAGKPTREKFLKFPASLCQLAVRLFCEAEIVGAIDGRFRQDIEDLSGNEKGSQVFS